MRKPGPWLGFFVPDQLIRACKNIPTKGSDPGYSPAPRTGRNYRCRRNGLNGLLWRLDALHGPKSLPTKPDDTRPWVYGCARGFFLPAARARIRALPVMPRADRESRRGPTWRALHDRSQAKSKPRKDRQQASPSHAEHGRRVASSSPTTRLRPGMPCMRFEIGATAG